MNKSSLYLCTLAALIPAFAAGSPAETRDAAPKRRLPAERTGADPAAETGTIKGVLKSPYARIAPSVIYIEKIEGREFELPEKNPVMDQKNKIFTPHLLPILVGSTIDFPNTDDVRHSVYSRKESADDFNLGQYDVGIVKHVKFETVGVTHLGCNIHAEMSAYIITRQNPYFTVIGKKAKGNFVIQDVPAGTWNLTFFHEKIKQKTIEVTVEAGSEAIVEFTGLKRK